jgi:hypothetical protein
MTCQNDEVGDFLHSSSEYDTINGQSARENEYGARSG